jgi:hypothetical protein
MGCRRDELPERDDRAGATDFRQRVADVWETR